MPIEIDIPNNNALSYADACLGDDGVRQLCAALQTRNFVTSLDLRGCNVHSEGAAALAELLLSGCAHRPSSPFVIPSVRRAR
eukprot:6074045-Prymnesium_polylepis.1